MGPLLLIGVFIVFLILISIAAQKAKEARRKAYADLAGRHGFQMVIPEPGGCVTGGFWGNSVVGDTFGLMDSLADVSPFNHGDSRTLTLIVYGPESRCEWFLFDYHYSTGSGKNRTTHSISAVVARTPVLFPWMTIRGQNFLDNIGGAIGFKDVQFELAEFNQRYYVKCSDERRAYDIIHPQMIEYLMSIQERDMTFNGSLFVVVHGNQPDVMEMERTMQDMQGFLERIPEYVRQDYGLPQGPSA